MKIQAKDWKKKGLFVGVGKLTFEAEDAEQAKLLKAIFVPFSRMPITAGDVAEWDEIAKAIREKFEKQEGRPTQLSSPTLAATADAAERSLPDDPATLTPEQTRHAHSLAREYLRRFAAGELLQIRLNDWQEEEPDRSTIAGQKAKTFASLETPFGDMVAVEWADGTCGWFPDFTDDDEEDYTPADTLAEAKGAATLWYVARLMENLEPAAPPTATPK